MLAGTGGTGLERVDRSESSGGYASLRSMDNASIAIVSRSSRTTNSPVIPGLVVPPPPPIPSSTPSSDRRSSPPVTANNNNNNKRKKRTTGGGVGSNKTPLELSEGFVRYLPIRNTDEVTCGRGMEDEDFLYSSCSELEDNDESESDRDREGEGGSDYYSASEEEDRGSFDRIRRKKAEALRRDMGDETCGPSDYSLDDRWSMSPDRATPLNGGESGSFPSPSTTNTTNNTSTNTNTTTNDKVRRERKKRKKSHSLRRRRNAFSTTSSSYLTCFGCWYDGMAEEEGESDPTNMNTLVKIFWDNYGNIANVALARMCHTFFKEQIYGPMREAGHDIEMWRTWQIKLHFEKHVLDPRIYIGETLKKYKNLASVLENRCVNEVEVGAGSGESTSSRSDSDVDPLDFDVDGASGRRGTPSRQKTVQVLNLDVIKLMLDVHKRMLDLYNKKTDLMNFNSKDCTIDFNKLGRFVNPNKRWKFAAES